MKAVRLSIDVDEVRRKSTDLQEPVSSSQR